MKLKYHFTIGLIASFILVIFFNFTLFSGLIVFLSSWLIDTDHYLWYGFEFKDWNPIHALKWRKQAFSKWNKIPRDKRDRFKRGVFIFHGIGFWLILTILSFFHKFFLWILIGVIIHIITDWSDLIKKGEPLYNKTFPFYVIKRNKNKKSLKEL